MPILLAQESSEQLTADVTQVWSKLDGMLQGFMRLVPNIIIAAVVFVVVMIVATIAKRLILRATRDREASNVGTVLGRLAQWTLLLVGLMLAVSIVSPSVGPAEFVGALGVTSVAIGFAFKDILQNFLAGILILLREPFKIGDAIQFGDYSGTVSAIETRSTYLRTWDGRDVIIPNGQIFTSPVEVITAHPQRRNSCTVGIGYADDIRAAQRLVLETIKSVEGVLEQPEPFVQTVELGASSVNLQAFWWTRNEDYGSAGSEVITRIKERLDEAGIDMPYPTQVHLLHDQTEATDGDRTQQREGWPAGKNPPRPRHALSNPERAGEVALNGHPD